MKLKILLFLGLACLIAATSARPAEEEYEEDYVEEAAPAPKPAARPSPLKGRRNPLTARANKPTSTTVAAPKEEELAEEEEEAVDVPADATSTTESPKKIKTGVRPFRSNDDLLAALKRRREQAAINKAAQPKAVHHEDDGEGAAAAPSNNKARPSGARKQFNRANKHAVDAPQQAEDAAAPSTAAPVRTGRRFSAARN